MTTKVKPAKYVYNQEEALLKYEPLVYYQIHKMNLWRQFPEYREDMLQEGRMAVLRAIDKYHDEPNLLAYIHNTVRNAIYDFVFRDMKLHVFGNHIPYEEVYGQTNLEVIREAEDLATAIRLHKDSSILVPYFLEGKTQAEVAESNNVSQQWVSSVINSFREQVKNGKLK